MPVDPSNNYDGIDPGRSGNRGYHYFCYTSPDRVSLRYRKEDNQVVTDVFEVAACLDTLPN